MNLQELKKLSPYELYDHWVQSRFPFDKATCGRCLTMHLNYCGLSLHSLLAMVAPDAHDGSRPCGPTKEGLGGYLIDHLEELYAARLFYKYFYPHAPEVEEPQPVEETVEAT